MKSYIVTNYSINPEMAELYGEYPGAAFETVQQYWGKVLVATQESNPIEGNAGNITVIIEFNSKKDALNWYRSKEYSEIKHLRTLSSESGWLLAADEFIV